MIKVMLAIVVACSVSAACAKESATPPSQPGGSAASTPAPSASAAPPSEPARPAATAFREVTVPAGTSLRVRLTSGIASDTSKVEDPVSGTVAVAVTAAGEMAIPAGSRITGSVLDANGSGRVKGRASLAFRFDQ